MSGGCYIGSNIRAPQNLSLVVQSYERKVLPLLIGYHASANNQIWRRDEPMVLEFILSIGYKCLDNVGKSPIFVTSNS